MRLNGLAIAMRWAVRFTGKGILSFSLFRAAPHL